MMESESCGIHSLPDEIIIMILKCLSYSDCNSFMRTCKRYNDILKSSHSLWKVIYKKTAGKVMHNIIAIHSEGNWMSDMRQYLSLRGTLIDFIAAMSAKHFRDGTTECGLEYVKEIFSIALSSNTNYYYTISIIQNYIREAYRKVNTYITESPYTLTEVYYGKMVVRYLMHVILAVKWAQNEAANLLTPEIVLNFFIQWIDPVVMHTDEEVRVLIKEMVRDVGRILLVTKDGVPLSDVETNRTGVNGTYSEREVLLAISHYMYKQRRMAKKHAFNEDTLNIVKTIKTNSGHMICFGAIFEAIARGFGITSCQLIAFPNHAYLEWRHNNGFRSEMMKFCLETGDLLPMGRCPFSENTEPNRVRFADGFAQYVANSYCESMGFYMSWRSNNASQLLHFFTNIHNSEYYNFLLYVRGLDDNKLTIPFNMEYLHEDQINCVHALLALNRTPSPRPFDMFVNHRVGGVMYCVGQICFNKLQDYVCVIRHWDTQMDPEFKHRLDSPSSRSDQPHYRVIAIDQTERYVAQENLEMIGAPARLYLLEEVLGREFSHFNGFFYIPNREKQMMFPDDLSVGNAFASQRKLIPLKVQRY